jgi:hypothetical protein
MIRTAGLAALLGLSCGAMGCTTDGAWSVRKAMGWEEVKTPEPPKLPPATLQSAERVHLLGRKIIADNELGDMDSLVFYTAGIPEPVLFHRGSEMIVISEGLVNQCPTQAELAAVLCSELGLMVAEKKAQKRAMAERDSYPEAGLANGIPVGGSGGTPVDPYRQAELAYRERQPKTIPQANPNDAARQGRDLLRKAGFDADELDRVRPLLKLSDRNAKLRKQMSGSAPAPTWNP